MDMETVEARFGALNYRERALSWLVARVTRDNAIYVYNRPAMMFELCEIAEREGVSPQDDVDLAGMPAAFQSKAAEFRTILRAEDRAEKEASRRAREARAIEFRKVILAELGGSELLLRRIQAVTKPIRDWDKLENVKWHFPWLDSWGRLYPAGRRITVLDVNALEAWNRDYGK